MTEYETNPQRQPATSDAEPSPAELSRMEREQSDSSTPAQPEASAAQPTPPAQSAPPVVSGPPAEPVTRQQPSVPAADAGFPPSPWHPAHQHQPGWPANAGYGSPGNQAPQGAVPLPGAVPPPGQPPIWAQPPTAAGHGPAAPSRVGKFAAAGVAALALMAGSGVAGGVIALALDHSSVISTSSSDNRAASAPVINRSSLAEIASKVENSVVSITTGTGEGSGVVLTADGYILSNNHVVASAQGDTVNVVFANGKNARARIVGTDPKTDLAVVKASGVSGLTPARFGDSSAMQVGDTVLALGSPLGLQGSVTAGIISAQDRIIQTGNEQESPFSRGSQGTTMAGLLQTDAPINPGNSGGALVNTNGEVIGINTAIATSGQSNGNIGVGFAIPSNKAKEVADALKKGGKVSHPFLGVSVSPSENGGAIVANVTPDSPAAKAGLQQGDIITKFGKKTIRNSDDLVTAVQSGKVGDRVDLTYYRNGAEKAATVTLAEAS